MELWLTKTQVQELTQRQQPAAQKKVLAEMGYTIRPRPDGSFIVPTQQFLTDSNTDNQPEYKLDFSAHHHGKAA
jgi:hypothetical protein